MRTNAAWNRFGIVMVLAIVSSFISSVTAQWIPSGSNVYTNGNVGIGTTNPLNKLQIGNSVYTNQALAIATSYGQMSFNLEQGRSFLRVDTRLDLIANGLTTVTLLNGNVGIGTISPMTRLDVLGSANNYAGRFTGSSTTNQSLGVNIAAGTSISDFALNVTNAASASLFRIRGDGNVGVGTTSPGAKLDVKGDIKTSAGAIRANGSNYQGVYIEPGANDLNYSDIAFYNGSYKAGRIDALTLCLQTRSSGAVGIGTTSPASGVKLHVNGNVRVSGGTSPYITLSPDAGTGWNIQNDQGKMSFRTGNGPTDVPLMTLANGTVGIGTLTPNSSCKLDVNGIIRAKEIKVSLNAGSGTVFPDFVFKPGYNLQRLENIEDFIKQKRHLPGIPSAKEAEEKGVALGEMQLKLLRKIEELTLYVIEQQKQIAELKNTMAK